VHLVCYFHSHGLTITTFPILDLYPSRSQTMSDSTLKLHMRRRFINIKCNYYERCGSVRYCLLMCWWSMLMLLWGTTAIRIKVTTPSIHLVVCLTTGPKPLPKRALHIVRSRASSFKWEYSLLSLRSSNSFLRLLPQLNHQIPVCYAETTNTLVTPKYMSCQEKLLIRYSGWARQNGRRQR
jgi:hypothetical protein